MDKETTTEHQQKNHKRQFAMTVLAVIFVGIAVIYALYWLVAGRFHEYTDDAYVNGNMVQLMPRVSGTVVAIYTDDTRLVLQGQTLIKLDQTDIKIAYKQAKAGLAQTVRQVKQYFENAAEMQQSLKLRAADLLKAKLDLKRRIDLRGENAVSREEIQHVRTSLEAAQAQYDIALHQLRAANALVANTTVYTHPLVKQAEAKFERAYINLLRTNIIAPITGIVAKRNVQVGQQVNMASPMLAIVPLKEIWIDANYKESQLRHLRIGQPVEVKVDASGFTYKGRVVGLNAGTGSAFSILPPQNATGNWIKIVQRLPVRISLDEKEITQHPLQLGLSVEVTTNTRDRDGKVLPTSADTHAYYATSVYEHELLSTKKMIEKILQHNMPLDKETS